jgi:hypothetical protein
MIGGSPMCSVVLGCETRTMKSLPASRPTRRRLRSFGAAVCVVALATASAISTGAVATAAAKKKPSTPKTTPSKPVFTASKLAGTYRWVKSTVKITFSDGKSGGGSLPYGPTDTITFVVKKGAGFTAGSTANGTYSTNVAAVGASSGIWYLRENGTVLEMLAEGETDLYFLVRRIDQLDAKRLTMSADSAMIVRAYNENGLGDEANKVVGGSAYDELIRVK